MEQNTSMATSSPKSFKIVNERPEASGKFTLHWTCECGLCHKKDIDETVRDVVVRKTVFSDESVCCYCWSAEQGKFIGCTRTYEVTIATKLKVSVTKAV